MTTALHTARPARHRPRRRGVRAPRRSDPRRPAARPASACATRSSPSDSASRAPLCAKHCSGSSAPGWSRSRRTATRASRFRTRSVHADIARVRRLPHGHRAAHRAAALHRRSARRRAPARATRSIAASRADDHPALVAASHGSSTTIDSTPPTTSRSSASCARPRSRSAATSPGWHPFIECPDRPHRGLRSFRDAVAERDGARAESRAPRRSTASPDRSSAVAPSLR